jgi:nonsense-mediated mRNA decay protein 3
VLDVERVESPKIIAPPTEKKSSSKKRRRQEAPAGPRVMKGFLADVTLARERDLGVNDDQLTVRTHLGALLRCGDRVLGYDVRAANLASSVDGLGGNEPDVVLVRKCRKQDPDGPTPKRHWKLDQMEADENHDDNDREMRSRVNLYKDGDHVDDDDEEGVRLEELLDEMKVEDEVEECAEDSVLEGVVVRGSGK